MSKALCENIKIISAMLNVRNEKKILIPYSKNILSILKIFKENTIIQDFTFIKRKNHFLSIQVIIAPQQKIRQLSLISMPGCLVNMKNKQLKRFIKIFPDVTLLIFGSNRFIKQKFILHREFLKYNIGGYILCSFI